MLSSIQIDPPLLSIIFSGGDRLMPIPFSWNLIHIVKFKTKFHVKKINKKLKEKDIIICTPEEMI
ncbi:MAG: hypothetical protein KAX33_09005 [Candidatus Lokiarchaeota archaeon]|nr:hypothetical protein [Candidatus Lokiarchaeota archaeon]